MNKYKPVMWYYHSWRSPPQHPNHILDQWLMSRVTELIQETTAHLDRYDVVRSSRSLMAFIDELSTWYLRLSRNRIRSADHTQVSQVFGHAIYTLAQLFAPFTPFFSEIVYQTLTNSQNSIHHTDWPTANPAFRQSSLEKQMTVVREVVTQAHAIRQDLHIQLRQPLASIKVVAPGEKSSIELLALVTQEMNVKAVDWQTGDELRISFDTTLTPELMIEGEARKLMRSIQKLRQVTGLKSQDTVTVTAPDWPEAWKDQIENQTQVKLIRGDKLEIVK